MSGEYQSPEDERAFKEILARDPESRKCFECGYPSAPWCDINHGIFVCLDCSGTHRGLGVHLSFVRSSTMDGWSNWRPEKLKQMQKGGNGRARAFFEAKGVPKAPIRARYNHVGALMYKDKLEAETAGAAFNEATWQPPDWANPAKQQEQQARNTGVSNNRYGGVGSAAGNQPQARRGGGGDDWMSALSSGLSSVAESTTRVASKAAEVTVASTSHLASKAREQSRDVNTDDISKKASDAAAATAAAASSAWGAFSSWTSGAVAQLSAGGGGGGAAGADDEDDGLRGLTRNVQRDGQSESDARFRGVEHRAEPGSPAAAAGDSGSGLAGITRELPRTSKYEGIGSSPVTAEPKPLRCPASGGMGSRQASSTSVPAGSTPTTRKPIGGVKTSPTPSAGSAGSPKPQQKKAPSADDWGWDDEE